MEKGRNSLEAPLSKTLVALKRVRSLRDPDTNSMSKLMMGIDNVNLDGNSSKDACLGLIDSNKHHVTKSRNYDTRERLEDIGSNSNSDSDSDYASSKKSSTIGIRAQNSRRGNLVRQPHYRRTKKSLEPSWFPNSLNIFDDEANSCSETRINRTARKKNSGYRSWRKPYKSMEEAAMSRVGSPCMSTSEARTYCSGRIAAGLVNDGADIVDSSISGCGISYCWSRTPKYRDPTLSPDVGTDEHPLISAEWAERSCREIVPYPVSPRSVSQKFRPKSFGDLVGLSSVANSLLFALSKGKIAPVYLFHGPTGTGKTSTARIFAAALNCLSLEEDRPCGFCRECVFLFSGRSRDVKELDASKINRKDRVKALLKSASLAPFSSQFKVFIIDECQFLKEETWASIFTSVEYFSRHSLFIMITTDPDKLPHSSLSQCQRYHFPKIKDADVSCRLQKICTEEELEYDKDALDFIATKSNGSLRDAETILDQLGLLGKRITLSLAYELIGVVSDEELLDLLNLALASDTTNTVRKARDLMKSRVDPMQLVSQLANLIMDILSGRNQLDVSEAGRIVLGRHASEVGIQKLRHALKVLSETEKQLRTSKNQATWLTVALLQFNTGDDGDLRDLSISSQRDSLKNNVCDGDQCGKLCSVDHCNGIELETVWRRALRKCQSKSLKSFLQKEGNLSSIHVNEGLAIAEIEFSHPDHVSRAEKSWKLIASSLQPVLGCDVQLRLKLLPTYISKRTKVKKSSFSLLSCSGRKQQISDSTMTDEDESETSSRGETFTGSQSSNNGQQLDSRRMKDVYLFNDKETVIIRKIEDDTRSYKTSVTLQNETKSKSDPLPRVDDEGRYVDIQEYESQPNCFSKTLKLRRRLLSADAAKSMCFRIQPETKQELTYFDTYDPYGTCSHSDVKLNDNCGEGHVSRISGGKEKHFNHFQTSFWVISSLFVFYFDLSKGF
ncbi:protein STICHEL-like 2 isoform X2 [Asparagus officinalis]|uniref:protein STICHEL-like 2 isoform X2 n=1 Tax=Asparagus officinalis TaxID=4686 RepID=UPI00098DF4C0|nr:protein STICHEL-like 2 isoform X2 [Asparagus officinalis]